MKKIRQFAFATIFMSAMFYSPNANAYTIERCYLFDNGCIGKEIYHNILWGLFEWVSYEVVSCP